MLLRDTSDNQHLFFCMKNQMTILSRMEVLELIFPGYVPYPFLDYFWSIWGEFNKPHLSPLLGIIVKVSQKL